MTRSSHRLKKQGAADITSELSEKILLEVRQDIVASGRRMGRKKRFVVRGRPLYSALLAEMSKQVMVIMVRFRRVASTFTDTWGRRG